MTRKGEEFSLLSVINHACRPRKVELPLGRRFAVEEIDGEAFKTDVLALKLKADDVKILIHR